MSLVPYAYYHDGMNLRVEHEGALTFVSESQGMPMPSESQASDCSKIFTTLWVFVNARDGSTSPVHRLGEQEEDAGVDSGVGATVETVAAEEKPAVEWC